MAKRPITEGRKTAAPTRGGRARPLGEMLDKVGGPAFRRFGFVQSAIVGRWREIVGERYAGATAPESIRFAPGKRDEGVLTLTVDSGFAVMVQHVAPEIVERVNRFFGYRAVARLAIRQGRVQPRPARLVRPDPRPAPAEMTEGLRAIADPGLRACLESLAARVSASEGLPRVGGGHLDHDDRSDQNDRRNFVPVFPGPIGKVN